MKLIVGNWKMYPTLSDSLVLAASLKKGLEQLQGVQIVIAPPIAWLTPLKEQWRQPGNHIHWAAQNVWPDDQGAFTGEVSAYFLKDLVNYTIVGHSERRTYQQESNELVERKVQACLRWSIKPIVCIGEQKRIFDGRGDVDTYEWDKLANQLLTAVQSLSAEQLSHVIIAYEPVWAIGSRNPASAEYTLQVIEKLKERLNKEAIKGASELQFLYGGSVSAENAANLLRHRDIDGLLVGSASVKAKEFIAITELAAQMR